MSAWDWLLILALAGIGLAVVWAGFCGGWADIGYTMQGYR